MTTLTDWTAQRSGADITIKGKDPAGAEITVARVTKIVTGKPRPVAYARSGARFELA